jgi:deazaflavin-dependent oxidoreductase (nitroreductase family)
LLYVSDGEHLAVFASNWGKRAHPAWALNLDAEPRAIVAVEGTSTPVLARRATGEEERRLWPEAERIYPGYAGYRARAGRDSHLRPGTGDIRPSWATDRAGVDPSGTCR